MSTSSAPRVKVALLEAARTLYPDALVSYGLPGSYQPNDIVTVMGSTTESALGPMSPSRWRDETVETVVLISCYRPGDETQQQVATEAAYSMLDALQDLLRSQGVPNMLGVAGCREARVTEHELTESVATSAANPKQVTGRTSVVAAVVRTLTRV